MEFFRTVDISTSESISMRELISASVDLAERGGREVVAVKKHHNENEKSKGETREGANDPVTDGDYRSHVKIISGFRKTFPQLHVNYSRRLFSFCDHLLIDELQVVSEEHDEGKLDLSGVQSPNLHIKEVTDHTNFDEVVPVEELTVWVDPLDATQEYTGSFFNKSNHCDHFFNQKCCHFREFVAICHCYGVHSTQRRPDCRSHSQTL